ncbi:MAG: phosphoribosylamine--glycine ligase, partial [bacterium]|nr:phosphoribosylamine--glycine ligase [bacterium]
MKILVIGGGGREHALVWKLAGAGHRIVCAPGNPGMAGLAECVAMSPGDLDGLSALARARAVELVVTGPEAPLVAGPGQRLRDAKSPAFGPS